MPEFITDPLQSNKSFSTDIKERPEQTFFFEKGDGKVFCCNEKQAWDVYMARGQIIGYRDAPKPKLIGVSDGTIYFKALREAKEIFEKEGLEASQARIKQAFNEELEAARGHIVRPRNFDEIDIGGNPSRARTQ